MNQSKLKTDSEEYIWHPFSRSDGKRAFTVIKASGDRIFTKEKGWLIDAISSWWVNPHGHSVKSFSRILKKQHRKLDHVIFSGFTHEPAQQLAFNLQNVLPNVPAKIFFSDNGSTSVEVALKVALQYQKLIGSNKKRIIALEGAYHGDTFGAMSVAERSIFNAPFEDKLFEADFISLNSEWPAIKNHLDTLTKANEHAAFIYEPLIQGAGGMKMYSVDLFSKLLKYMRDKNILLIADEIMTGFWRSGKLFSSDYFDVKPEVICISKAITGGFMPLGLTCVAQQIYHAFDSPESDHTLYHGHSYTAYPLACATANHSLKMLCDKKTEKNVRRLEAFFSSFAKKLSSHKNVENIRTRGTIFAFDILGSGPTSYTNKVRDIFYNYCIDRGVLLRPLGNVVYILPPYNISEKNLKTVFSTIESALAFINKEQ